tara:strand:- start:202 stop:486 length:285 start_codon:yes stop_codon:yes gene_type:complete
MFAILHKPSPLIVSSPPVIVMQQSTPPQRWRRVAFIVWLCSFVPYFTPQKPTFYKDQKTSNEIRRQQNVRKVNNFLGGNIDRTEFGNELFSEGT